ncbi:hypothetical protein BESB_084030 [Besnoitia besnoiti]|uniref:Uncharacterized protein n=1 Tax=Besnoitia besnoiti TaxID=94643 RepID=A0A2A9M7P9_BESBE|nr:hypothetical protein BESB_084030 [Besnoitia besnoiti]PFH33204.1 hypothetical protein BESB_084030 [Besnoitia besnoiti]
MRRVSLSSSGRLPLLQGQPRLAGRRRAKPASSSPLQTRLPTVSLLSLSPSSSSLPSRAGSLRTPASSCLSLSPQLHPRPSVVSACAFSALPSPLFWRQLLRSYSQRASATLREPLARREGEEGATEGPRERDADAFLPLLAGRRDVSDEHAWLEVIRGIQEKREGSAAALWLNAVAPSASPLAVLQAAVALQERKWLGSGEGKKDEAKQRGRPPPKASSCANIQKTLLRNVHTFADPFFVLALKLLFSSSFTLPPSDRAYLMRLVDQRLSSLPPQLLPHVAAALTQNQSGRASPVSPAALAESTGSHDPKSSPSLPPLSSSESPSAQLSAASLAAAAAAGPSPPLEALVRRRVAEKVLPRLLSDARETLFAPAHADSVFEPTASQARGEPWAGAALGCDALKGSTMTASLTACVASLCKLAPLSVEERVALKAVVKEVVREAREWRAPKESPSASETASRAAAERPNAAPEEKLPAGADGLDAEKVNSWLEMTETHSGAAAGKRLQEPSPKPPLAASQMVAREARVLAELLHLPAAMAALGSADALLFFDALDASYKFFPWFTDAQLATFCRRAALIQFEKKSDAEQIKRVDGFHLFTLFLADRLSSMSPPRQAKLGSLLAALALNHPPAFSASLKRLASSFLAVVHPSLVRGTGNLWSGVDPLQAPALSRYFSRFFSPPAYCSFILLISRTFALFASAGGEEDLRKLRAALRVYQKSLERFSQERRLLAAASEADLIALLEASLRLSAASLGEKKEKRVDQRDAGAFECNSEMTPVFSDVLDALHKRANSLTAPHAELLLGVLSLIGRRPGDSRKHDKQPPPSPCVLSASTSALLARLLHIAATRRDALPSTASASSATAAAYDVFPKLGGDSPLAPTRRRATEEDAFLRARPLSFNQFLLACSEDVRGDGDRRAEADGTGLVTLTQSRVKQLRVAMQLLLPRPLEVFRTSGMPEDVLALLLFSLEATIWVLGEIEAQSTFVSLSAPSRRERLDGTAPGSPFSAASASFESAAAEEEGDAADAADADRRDREAALLTVFGVTRQTLAGALGTCGLLLEEMHNKDRRRTQVVGLTSRLARLVPADVAASVDRRLLTESLLRALPSDVDALRLQCVELLGLRAIKRQEVLFEKNRKRKEKRRQQGLRREHAMQAGGEEELSADVGREGERPGAQVA